MVDTLKSAVKKVLPEKVAPEPNHKGSIIYLEGDYPRQREEQAGAYLASKIAGANYYQEVMCMWSGGEGIKHGLAEHQDSALITGDALTLYPLPLDFSFHDHIATLSLPRSSKNGTQG